MKNFVNEEFRKAEMYAMKRTEVFLEALNDYNTTYHSSLFRFDDDYIPNYHLERILPDGVAKGGSIIRMPEGSGEKIYSDYSKQAELMYVRWYVCADILKYWQHVLSFEQRMILSQKYFSNVCPVQLTPDEVQSKLQIGRTKYFSILKDAKEIILELMFFDKYDSDGTRLPLELRNVRREQRCGKYAGFVQGEHPEWLFIFSPNSKETEDAAKMYLKYADPINRPHLHKR